MCCDGRVVKASDSKSDGVTRTGSNPVRSEFFSKFTFQFLDQITGIINIKKKVD